MDSNLVELIKELKSASRKNDAPIWSKIAKNALKSNSNKKKINLKKIDQLTDDGNAVIISGKILGTGKLSHKVLVSSFSILEPSIHKIFLFDFNKPAKQPTALKLVPTTTYS